MLIAKPPQMPLALGFALWAVTFTQWRALQHFFGTLTVCAARFALC